MNVISSNNYDSILAVLSERLNRQDGLINEVREFIADIAAKTTVYHEDLKTLYSDLRLMRQEDLANINKALEQTKENENHIRQLDARIQSLEKITNQLVFNFKIWNWVGASIGIAIITLLFAIFSGQASLIFN